MNKSIRVFAMAAGLAACVAAQAAKEVEVNDSMPTRSGARWVYDFSLTNADSQAVYLMDYYVPYFSDSDIQNLVAPAGWVAEVTFESKFDAGETGVLHWYASTANDGIGRQQTLGRFGYDAAYGGAKAPYIAGFSDGDTVQGDPFIPASPLAIAAGFKPVAAVPEPETWAMMILGLAGLGALEWRRVRHSRA